MLNEWAVFSNGKKKMMDKKIVLVRLVKAVEVLLFHQTVGMIERLLRRRSGKYTLKKFPGRLLALCKLRMMNGSVNSLMSVHQRLK